MTNDTLKENISNLLSKIEIELISLKYYKTLKESISVIEKEIEEEKKKLYSDNNLNLKIAYANLLYIYETKIEALNKLVRESTNQEDVFLAIDKDNSQKLESIQKEIEEIIDFLKGRMPEIGTIIEEKYKNEIKNLNSELETIKKHENTSRKAQINGKYQFNLSLYPDANTLIRTYINKLTFFKENIVEYKNLKEKEEEIERIVEELKEKYKSKIVIDTLNNSLEAYKKGIKDILDELNVFNRKSIQEHINALQEKMLETLNNIETIASTKERNDEYFNYLSTISMMDVDYDKILEIEKVVLETGQYEEIFYKVLYLLIEKEKYYHKYNNSDFILFNRLNEKSKTKLERMFVEGFIKLSEEEIEQIVRNYKLSGYLNTMDLEYEKYFESIKQDSCEINTEKLKDDIITDTSLENQKFKALSIYSDNIVIKEIIRNEETKKKIFKAKNIFVIRYLDENRLFITAVKHTKKEAFIIDADGNILFRSDKISNLDLKLLNLISVDIYEDNDYINKVGHALLDKDGNQVKFYPKNETEKQFKHYADKKHNRVVYITDKTIDFFDQDGKLINSFDLENNPYNLHVPVIDYAKYNSGYITLVNTIFGKGKRTIGIIDCNGEFLIKPFTINNEDFNDVLSIGFRESLSSLPYEKDGNVYFGYINEKGEYVLKNDYLEAFEFINGVARVKIKKGSKEYLDLIDKNGNSVLKQYFKGCIGSTLEKDIYLRFIEDIQKEIGTLAYTVTYKIPNKTQSFKITICDYQVTKKLYDSRPMLDVIGKIGEEQKDKALKQRKN